MATGGTTSGSGERIMKRPLRPDEFAAVEDLLADLRVATVA
ncbi:hypothetical protein [Micromonospora chersina]